MESTPAEESPEPSVSEAADETEPAETTGFPVITWVLIALAAVLIVIGIVLAIKTQKITSKKSAERTMRVPLI